MLRHCWPASPTALEHAIHRSCRSRPRSSSADEREQGERALLNLGHTFGHAIEAATGYVEWLHGEAVGTGHADGRGSVAAAGTASTPPIVRGCAALLAARGAARSTAPRIGAARALDYMRVDKKVQSGRVRLVLLEGLAARSRHRRLSGLPRCRRRSRLISDEREPEMNSPAGPAPTPRTNRSRAAAATLSRRRSIAASSSAIATASSIPMPSAAWRTRPRCSSITKAICTAPA